MWRGKLIECKDRSYEQFNKFHQGITCCLYILGKYYTENNANTIEKLITRYAKPNTILKPYFDSVSKGIGLKPRQVIKWNRENLYLIITEIARFENKGRNANITPDIFALSWLKCYE